MPKQSYSIRLEKTNREQLKYIPIETVRHYFEAFCNAYANGAVNEAFIMDIEKKMIKSQIKAHEEAIRELEAKLQDIDKNIEEATENYFKEQKELEKVWTVLYITHFEKEALRTIDDVNKIISSSYIPSKDIILYSIQKVENIQDNTTKKDKQTQKKCDWLDSKLKDLLNPQLNIL